MFLQDTKNLKNWIKNIDFLYLTGKAIEIGFIKMIKKTSQKKEIKKPKAKPTKKQVAKIEKPKDVNKNIENKVDKVVDIYDFSEEGYREWFKALSSEAKSVMGSEPVVIPPAYIVETIRFDPKIGLETIFIPDYKELKSYGRATRLRLVSLAIKDKYALSKLTYLINNMNSYRDEDPSLFDKALLIAEDMRQASKSILGKRIAKSIYRKNTIEMITSTMGTITVARPAPKPENNGPTQEESTPVQDTKTPTVE